MRLQENGSQSRRRVEGNFTAAKFIEFCKRLLNDATAPVFLIVDGHPAHRAKAVKDYVASTDGRLRLFFLPGYSPELNPDEWVWKNVKNDRVAKQVPMNKAELKWVWLFCSDVRVKLQDRVLGSGRGGCGGVPAAGAIPSTRRSRRC